MGGGGQGSGGGDTGTGTQGGCGGGGPAGTGTQGGGCGGPAGTGTQDGRGSGGGPAGTGTQNGCGGPAGTGTQGGCGGSPAGTGAGSGAGGGCMGSLEVRCSCSSSSCNADDSQSDAAIHASRISDWREGSDPQNRVPGAGEQQAERAAWSPEQAQTPLGPLQVGSFCQDGKRGASALQGGPKCRSRKTRLAQTNLQRKVHRKERM
ncbi:loricrin-like [Echeneis naucrates]|uniref:loricrin-like n=1 Tax=Echeneis naucrates TaxID=173247 RepID=UPI0011136EEE|nr:loricrin-like [Echeneis naucrates]